MNKIVPYFHEKIQKISAMFEKIRYQGMLLAKKQGARVLYKIGVVGTGYWGPNIVKSFELTGKAKVQWLCESDPQRLQVISANYPHAKTTCHLESVLEDPQIIAVAISTPVSTHYELARKSLIAGKHVLLEKPMTLNSQQAVELACLAHRQKKILMVGHVFEYNSSIRALKEFIVRGDLGAIQYMHFERTNLGPVRTDVNALWDLGTHDISIMCYLLDDYPEKVTARGHAFLNKEREDVVFAAFSFKGDILAHIHVSWVNPRKVRQITVVGDEKMAIWDDLDLKAPIRIYDKKVEHPQEVADTFLAHKTMVVDGGISIPQISLNQPLKAECLHFLDCIAKNRTPLSDSRSGLQVVAALEAANLSMASNSVITDIEVPRLPF